MIARPAPRVAAPGASRPLLGARRALLALGCCLALATLAGLPRLTDPAIPVTADETNWYQRTSDFARALLLNRPERTFLTGHPGVTTMELAALGMGLQQARDLDGTRIRLLDTQQRALFVAARRALALAQVGLLLVALLLAWRLFGAAAGLLAGLLLALEPWYVAHGRILHLDGLLAGCLAVTVLAALARWEGHGGLGYVALAGAAAGLAAITKSSALVLLPPLLLPAALATAWRRRAGAWRVGLDLVLLLACACLVAWLAWPSLQARPRRTVEKIVEFGRQTAEQPHESFFLGRPTLDPGPAFYPLVLAVRLSPATLVGLAALVVVAARARGTGVPVPRAALWLLLGAALVALTMGLSPKKQDRYVLPAVPLLAIAAAVGYRRALPPARGAARAGPLVLGVVGLAQLLQCAAERPYYFSYYSPLLGGTAAAARVLPVGWGEGLDRVADYLNQLPANPPPLVEVPTVTGSALQAQTRARVVGPGESPHPDFALDYVGAEQRGHVADAAGARLVLTVRLDGVDYARLYALK